MRGLKTDRSASIIIRGHAFSQNMRRGFYELGVLARHPQLRLPAVCAGLPPGLCPRPSRPGLPR